MPLLTLFSGNKSRRVKLSASDGSADILLIDVTNSENITFESEVPEHPVEEGPDVNDHIRLRPIMIELDCTISKTPLTFDSDLAGALKDPRGALTGFAGGVAANIGRKFGSKSGNLGAIGGGFIGASLIKSAGDPAEVARRTLEKLWASRERFTIQTKFQSYENVVIKRLSFPRTRGMGGVVNFTMTLQQIRVVTGESVAITKLSRSVAGKAAAKSKLGNQPATALNPQNEKKASALFKLFN